MRTAITDTVVWAMRRHQHSRTCSPVFFPLPSFVLEVNHHCKRGGPNLTIELPKGEPRIIKLRVALGVRNLRGFDNIPVFLIDHTLVRGIQRIGKTNGILSTLLPYRNL